LLLDGASRHPRVRCENAAVNKFTTFYNNIMRGSNKPTTPPRAAILPYGRVGLVLAVCSLVLVSLWQSFQRTVISSSKIGLHVILPHDQRMLSQLYAHATLTTRSPTPPTATLAPSTASPTGLYKPAFRPQETFEQAFSKYRAEHNPRVQDASAHFPTDNLLTLHCWGGSNNCVLASVSSLILAMLTNRTFLSKQTSAFANSINHTSSLRWIMSDAMVNFYHRELGRNIGTFRSEWRMESPPHIKVNRFPVHDLLCENFSVSFPHDVVDIHANNYFLPLIARNPYYKRQLEAWFGGGGGKDEDDNMYARIYRALVTPTQSVLDLKKDFFREAALGEPPERCLAVQVRTTMNKDNQQALNAIRRILHHKIKHNKNLTAGQAPVLYVASDNQGVRDLMTSFAAEEHIRVGFVTSIDLHQLSHEDNTHYSLAETLAAAECRLGLVVTRGSTFGYTMAALSRADTVIRFGGDGASRNSPRLSRSL
jgi:hypothetical protein